MGFDNIRTKKMKKSGVRCFFRIINKPYALLLFEDTLYNLQTLIKYFQIAFIVEMNLDYESNLLKLALL
jgi:hypothetical protein